MKIKIFAASTFVLVSRDALLAQKVYCLFSSTLTLIPLHYRNLGSLFWAALFEVGAAPFEGAGPAAVAPF